MNLWRAEKQFIFKIHKITNLRPFSKLILYLIHIKLKSYHNFSFTASFTERLRSENWAPWAYNYMLFVLK